MQGRHVLAPLALLMLVGCASVPAYQQFQNQPKPLSKPDKALVYVYRLNMFEAGGLDIHIYVGDQLIGTLPNGCYLYFYAQPGLYAFIPTAIGQTSIPSNLRLEAGKTYYVRVDFGTQGFSGTIGLDELNAALSLPELTQLRFMGLSFLR